MSLQLTPAMENRFEQIAGATGRPVSELVEEAITRYPDDLELKAGELESAEVEADRDGWLTTDEVFARLDLDVRKSA